MKTIQQLILNQLVHDKDFFNKVLPYLKRDYFETTAEKVVFDAIHSQAEKYRTQATPDEISVSVQSRRDLTGSDISDVSDLIETAIKAPPSKKVDAEWMVDQAENFCRKRAIHIALFESINIMNGENKKLTEESIPDILKEAISVRFDSKLGSSYFRDVEWRHRKYNEVLEKLPFRIPYFNKITHGGVPRKTLNVIAAGTNSFKSGGLCDFSAGWLLEGKNVLYVTLEMAEERILERIDANLMKLKIQDVHALPFLLFKNKVGEIRDRTPGELIVKEYPPATIHAGHIRALLKELELKDGFVPDVLVVDYLNLMAPMRFRTADNLYTANKAVSEELRGLGVEFDIPVWTATQFNRAGNNNPDPSVDNVGESHGISATADFMIAFIITEELDEKNLILIKQIKNRYNDKSINRKTMLGVNKAMMTLFELGENDPGAEILLNSKRIIQAESAVERVLTDTDEYGLAKITKFGEMFAGKKFT